MQTLQQLRNRARARADALAAQTIRTAARESATTRPAGTFECMVAASQCARQALAALLALDFPALAALKAHCVFTAIKVHHHYGGQHMIVVSVSVGGMPGTACEVCALPRALRVEVALVVAAWAKAQGMAMSADMAFQRIDMDGNAIVAGLDATGRLAYAVEVAGGQVVVDSLVEAVEDASAAAPIPAPAWPRTRRSVVVRA